MFLNINNSKNNFKRKLTAGSYDSAVASIDFHPDYVGESALLVTYSLTDKSGREFPYKETFINDMRNDRTREFFEYLEANGVPIDSLEKFQGCKEKITLKKDARGYKVYLTIVQREFISKAIEGEVFTVDVENSESQNPC